MVRHAVLDQILPLTIRPIISNLPLTPASTLTRRCLDFSKRAPLTSQAKSPLILKLNAHDLLHEEKDPLGALTASVSDALRLGCVAIGYTIYPGTAERRLQYEQLRELANEAKAAGLVVVVWSYPRGGGLSKEGETALDVIAYGAHIAALLGAHIIKVKMPTAHLELPDARKVYEDQKIPRDTAANRVRHVVQSVSMDAELSFSPVDQSKAMKPFWPKHARSATAADSAQLSGGILSSATKRPLCASLMRWSVSTKSRIRKSR